MDNCLFCQICSGQSDSMVLYEDDEVMAFKDIDPKAPLHVLIVPKKHYESAAELTEADGAMLGKVFRVAADICKEEGITKGYRVVTNVGADGGQSVPHLHFHLLAGRALAWPPG